MLRIGMAVALLIAAGGAAAQPAGQGRERYAGVNDGELCSALSRARPRGPEAVLLRGLAEERGLPCSAATPTPPRPSEPAAPRVADACAPLALERQEEVRGRGRAYYVRNNASRPVSFKINDGGITSGTLTIGPRQSKGFGVEVTPGLGTAGRFINRNDPQMLAFRFYDCR